MTGKQPINGKINIFSHKNLLFFYIIFKRNLVNKLENFLLKLSEKIFKNTKHWNSFCPF